MCWTVIVKGGPSLAPKFFLSEKRHSDTTDTRLKAGNKHPAYFRQKRWQNRKKMTKQEKDDKTNRAAMSCNTEFYSFNLEVMLLNPV